MGRMPETLSSTSAVIECVDNAIGFLQFSPRLRGWTRDGGRRDQVRLVSPAPARVDQCAWTWPVASTIFFRARAGGPPRSAGGSVVSRFLPRPRGWTVALVVQMAPGNVSSAPARVDPRPMRASRSAPGFFRACAGGPGYGWPYNDPIDFLPRLRGWTGLDDDAGPGRHVFSAPARVDPKSVRA